MATIFRLEPEFNYELFEEFTPYFFLSELQQLLVISKSFALSFFFFFFFTLTEEAIQK